eukprot:scaffold3734_cov425-Prasinococcus_capsulatus_cf.AAC.2
MPSSRTLHRRDPYDTPLRDGNRDRLMGLLTRRAVATLRRYCMETDPTLTLWLESYMHEHEIPLQGTAPLLLTHCSCDNLCAVAHGAACVGTWEEVSGDKFLLDMLKCENKYMQSPLSDTYGGETHSINVRELAERILSIRAHLAEEWRQDLLQVKEDNADLLRSVSLWLMPALLASQGPSDGRHFNPCDRECLLSSYKLESHIDEEHGTTPNNDLLR